MCEAWSSSFIMKLYEILVPCMRNNGVPIRTRCHREWDRRVRKITGGLTVMQPGRGQWVFGDTLFSERMIPVRIYCTESQIEAIADITAKFYEQLAVMYYVVSEQVVIKEYHERSSQSS